MWDFTPCKKVNVFKYDESSVYIVNASGITQLNTAGRLFWKMADGKNSVSKIVAALCDYYQTSDRQEMYDNLIKLMKALKRKNLLVMNWDPLYKSELKQEEVEDCE